MKIKQEIVFDTVSAKLAFEMLLKSKRMKKIKKGILIMAILCIILYLLTLFMKRTIVLFIILGIFVLFTGYVMLPFYIRLLNAGKVVSLIGKKESYTINEKTIRITSTLQSGVYNWKDVSDIIDWNGYIGILIKGQRSVLLRKSALNKEEMDWVLKH